MRRNVAPFVFCLLALTSLPCPQDAKKQERGNGRDGDSSDVQRKLIDESSNEDGDAHEPEARAHARGHGGDGFMASLQSKWDKMWGKKNEDADAIPKEWGQLREQEGGNVLGDSEELVGDRYGMNDEDDARVWGRHDEHATGNVYTPGEEKGSAPPKIVDRGWLADAPRSQGAVAEEAALAKDKARVSDKLASFMSAVGGGLGPQEDEVEVAEELARAPRELQSNEDLEESVRQNLDKVQQWYRELQRAKIEEMQNLVVAGKPQEALESLREGNVLQPEFNSTRELLAAGAGAGGVAALLGTVPDGGLDGAKGSGFLQMAGGARHELLSGAGLTLEKVRECYKGWSEAAVANELELLALHVTTIWVPQHARSLPDAVRLSEASGGSARAASMQPAHSRTQGRGAAIAIVMPRFGVASGCARLCCAALLCPTLLCSTLLYSGSNKIESNRIESNLLDPHRIYSTLPYPNRLESKRAGQRIGVAPGDYEWDERLVVGQDGDTDTRLRLAGGQTFLPLPIPMAAGEAGETRLWGRWAMGTRSWGSIANVTCLFESVPRSGRALFLVTG